MRGIARAETLTIRNTDFIAAVRLQGASPPRIMLRHVVPLCLSSVIVRVTLDMAGIILTAAGLGFLGLGAQPPIARMGRHDRRPAATFLIDQWWVATMPGLAIFVVSLGFNLLGDGLRDVLDPEGGDDERRRRSSRSRICRSRFHCAAAVVDAVRGVSFTLGRERLGIVGESGSGKSQTGRAILGLTPPPGEVTAKRLAFDGTDLLARPTRAAARPARQPHHDGDAGPEIFAQSGDDGRRADRRSLPRARASATPRAKRATRRSPCSRRCTSAIPSASFALSARGVGRHGPARDDRDDAGHRARTC